MPSVTIPLPDIEQVVARPSIYQVIEQVREILDMDTGADVVYAGKRGVIRARGSAVTELGQDNEAKFTSDTLLKIEVVETYDLEAVQEIQAHSWDTAPIFCDPKLGISLRPIYIPSKVDITFNYQSDSETEVNQWLANQISRCSRGRGTYLHHAVYQYPLPYEFFHCLKDVHTLREANEGYGDTFEEYFNAHRINRITTLSDFEGGKKIPVVHEKQGQIVGQFDFPVAAEKPEFDKEKGIWQTRFVYSYVYQRPDQVFLHYPISVHNSFMPEIYLKYLESEVDYETKNAYYSNGMAALNAFSLTNPDMALRAKPTYVQIPSFDDFKPEVKRNTATIFMVRCALDDGKQLLLDIQNDLEDYTIDSDILDFLKTEAPYLTKRFFSVFNFEHYINGQLQDYDSIEVTPELLLRAKKPLSMRDVHHVRFCAIPDIDQSLYSALKRVSAHPKAFVKIVRAFNELLALDPDFGSLATRDKIEDWMFTSVYRIMFMTHQGNLHSTGTNLDSYINEMVFTDKNLLGLLTGLHPTRIKRAIETKRRQRLVQMNAAIFVKHRKDM